MQYQRFAASTLAVALALSSAIQKTSAQDAAPPTRGDELQFAQPHAFINPPRQPPTGELEQLAVDIARRAVLALYPHAGDAPIRTIELMVRPAGDEVHTYAKVVWFSNQRGAKWHTSEVYATLIYTPGLRRIYDLSYKDDYWAPHRDYDRRNDLISKINEEFERRDPLRMPHPLMGPHLDQLAPRKRTWSHNPFGGDHPWHVSIADDRVHPAFIPTLRRPAAP